MKLENQVVSLELAQKLKELGVKQESLFYWDMVAGGAIEIVVNHGFTKNITNKPNCHDELSIDCVSAYTVAELGEMLPEKVVVDGWSSYKKLHFQDGKCGIYYSSLTKIIKVEMVVGKTEADARAKMLIYLLENKLITL